MAEKQTFKPSVKWKQSEFTSESTDPPAVGGIVSLFSCKAMTHSYGGHLTSRSIAAVLV